MRVLHLYASAVNYFVRTSSRKALASIENYLKDPNSLAQCVTFEQNVKDFGLMYFGMKDRRQGELAGYCIYPTYFAFTGIVHIIGPEQGFTVRYLPTI